MAIIFCGNAFCVNNEMYYCQADRIEVDMEGKCITQKQEVRKPDEEARCQD